MGLWRALGSLFRDPAAALAERPRGPRTHAEALQAIGQTTLTFKDAESALAYACNFMESPSDAGDTLPGIIDEVGDIPPFGMAASVRVSSSDGPRKMTAALPFKGDDFVARLRCKGKLCVVLLGPIVPLAGGERAAVVIALLEPRWTPDGWQIAERFEPR